ncbi:MAG: DUF1289 domain-containing protein [Planctomycetota bacterium]|jgi:predicted Fe-S protein YdhL (DUF1289 family)
MPRRRRTLWKSLKKPETLRGEDCTDASDVPSPCTGDCRLDGEGICADCHRTLDEIAAWGGLSAVDKQAVVEAATRRARSR